MTMLLETRHADGFIVSEIDTGRLSRDQGTLALGHKVPAGTVLGLILGTTAPPPQPLNANVGNGTFTTIAVAGTAMPGAYVLTLTSGTAFSLAEPNGTLMTAGTVGTAYNAGGLSFTLNAGGTPFAAGDGFVIEVGGQYVAFDPTASDGSQTAVAIALNDTDASLVACNIGVLARLAEINATELVWGPNVTTTTQQLTALAQLAQKQIIARQGAGIATYE